MGFDDARPAAIARTSIDASGAPDDLKRDVRARIDTWAVGDDPIRLGHDPAS
jgi:hypothetical protein